MGFPYGRAPLAILIVSLLSGAALLWGKATQVVHDEPDLIMATFTRDHYEAYRTAIAQFEKELGVKIQVQVVDPRALNQRLQAAFQAGAPVPDMVELRDGSMGTFTKGPLEDVGFVDLTELVHTPGVLPGSPQTTLYEASVPSRFSKWSSRGRVFALPHDVHPVMLAYRADLVEELGIDPDMLTTWEEFCRVGREIATKDLDGDGTIDRYMIDLPSDGGGTLRLLLLQRGGEMFDAEGKVAFDSEAAAEVVAWYVRQVAGPQRIAFAAGSGQTFARAVIDGLCLFYVCPDWRADNFVLDIPRMSGKIRLMPLPAWEEGGRRTSTWGGTGLAFTKQGAERGRFDLAWKLAQHLYYNPDELGPRFAATYLLPPLRAAWDQPELAIEFEYYGGQRIGLEFAALAPHVPAEQSNPYMSLAEAKFFEAYSNTLLHFQAHGDAGLEAFALGELRRTAAHVRDVMERNRFLNPDSDKEDEAR